MEGSHRPNTNVNDNLDNNPTTGVINMLSEFIDSKGVWEEEEAEGSTEKRRWIGEANISSSNDVVSFSSDDVVRVQTPHNDTIVISMTIANYNVKKILVDNESFINILFYDVFQKMKLPKDRLKQGNAPLVGFSSNLVAIEGKVGLLMTVRKSP